MKTKTIKFTDDCGDNLTHSLKAFVTAFYYLWKALQGVGGLFYRKVIKEYPLACIITAAGLTFMITLFSFGSAVRERNEMSKELYLANQKLERYGIK